MDTDQSSQRKNLASTYARAAMTWGPGIALMILTGPLGSWARTAGWTVGLVWLGAFCVLNYSRCRRVHCMFTGPFFLGMAVVTLLVGTGAISLGQNSWGVLGNTVLIGGIVLCFGPELIWGRYWPRVPSEHQRSA
jgi:hypothetical protein